MPVDRPSSGIGGRPHVLFLTSSAPTDPEQHEWNTEILGALSAHSVDCTLLSYRADADVLTPQHVADTYTHVCFLLLGEYTPHHTGFIRHLEQVLRPARRLNPRLRVLNGPRMAAWSSDKSYLRDLKAAGFGVPDTTILSPRQPIDYIRFALNTQTHSNPIVVKPSISASGRNTHRIREPAKLTEQDDEFLSCLLDTMQNGYNQSDSRPASAKSPTSPLIDAADDEGCYGSIMLQEYVPEIKNGEYSLCYFGGELRYTVLKRPQPGGWQVNRDHGGTAQLIPRADVPDDAVEASQAALDWISARFEDEELAYARVDGVLRDDGSFVFMEIELLEPALFLDKPDTGDLGLDAICKFVTRPPNGLDRSVSYG